MANKYNNAVAGAWLLLVLLIVSVVALSARGHGQKEGYERACDELLKSSWKI